MLIRTSWELSTIGHPMSDLINLTFPYFLVANNAKGASWLDSFKAGATPGLPTQAQLMKWYAEVAGFDPTPDIEWCTAFQVFRAAAIYQGIAARYAVRQASSAKAKENAEQRHPTSALAWKQVCKCMEREKGKPKL